MKIVKNTHTDNQVKNLFQNLPKCIICLSHLRWDFVYQRPQHLLTRLAETFQIFFIEEPVFDAYNQPYYAYLEQSNNIYRIIPHLPNGLNALESVAMLKLLFDQFMENKNLSDFAFWYYTPMALEFTRRYIPDLIVYDCMDELSAFKFAPEALKELEQELLKKADIVFTGGQSLYEAKKNQHANIYPFPSSIDKKHFEQARHIKQSLSNKRATCQPTLGYYGVIDERFDIDLISGIADMRPDWQIVLVGPIVKIDPSTLPQNSNIQYLGPKNYVDLPSCLATWDVALIPFLLNESTRYISPTKTPEYLAAGVPVISTPIRDVINPYGKNKLVAIGSTAEEFVTAAEYILQTATNYDWTEIDDFLDQNSWDKTCQNMLAMIKKTITSRSLTSTKQIYV
ncbi:MAG: UDP-galactopyranose mutase [Mucilaginibacter sp.]|nr:UDP-galactopyranose mutase [Mucilaginibacter sp.]